MKYLAGALLLAACASPTMATPPAVVAVQAPAPAPEQTPPVVEAVVEPLVVQHESPSPPKEDRPVPVLMCTGTALVFLLDRSGSMQGLPLEMAKRAAATAVDALGPSDCFELIAFDSTSTRVVPLTAVVDRGALKVGIGRVEAGGGTELGQALSWSLRDIGGAPRAKRRLVVLLTDGQAASSGLRDLAEAIWNEAGVVSTIGLGPGIDENLLRAVANAGHGRMYKVLDPIRLPAVMTAELAAK